VSRPDADLLIAGGGLAAQRCCEALRRLGYDGRIVVLCEEQSAPYDRPPLSKAILSGEREPEGLAFRAAAWYEEHDVELLLGVAAQELDIAGSAVRLRKSNERGDGASRRGGSHRVDRLRFGELLIATGSRPRRLPGVALGGAVHELRTYDDALSLRAALRDRDGRLAILGGGLIGMEVAGAARALGRDVTILEAATTPLERLLPPALGRWIAYLHHLHGVDIRLGTTAERASSRADGVRLALSDTSTLDAGTVLVAAGTMPATEWLAGSGLGPGSLATDAGGRTECPGVYAAGDAASFPDPYLGERIPSQHWEAAVRQGIAVARTIVGLPPAASVPSMCWSDQHGHRIQLVGHPSRDCEIELDGDPAAGSFAAWITRAGRARGVLLVDRPDSLPLARKWIATGSTGGEDDGSDNHEHEENEVPDDMHTGDRRVRVPRSRRLRGDRAGRIPRR